MEKDLKAQKPEKWGAHTPFIGIILIVSGILFLLDRKLNTHWLSLSIPVFISLVLLAAGILSKRRLWLIPGFILFGLGAAAFVVFQKLVFYKTFTLICVATGVFALSWLVLFLALLVIRKSAAWWALFVATISGAVSINFFTERLRLLDFVLTISIAIGVVFLLWGGRKKQIGLMIPGLLITTMGCGVFFAWMDAADSQGLQETGIMLVWFALGWLLITVTSKIFSRNFVWWPLIPGGVLAMVGSGLYIGGNPGNALGFFQNTGSIALILFGIYLILLKYGMKK